MSREDVGIRLHDEWPQEFPAAPDVVSAALGADMAAPDDDRAARFQRRDEARGLGVVQDDNVFAPNPGGQLSRVALDGGAIGLLFRGAQSAAVAAIPVQEVVQPLG